MKEVKADSANLTQFQNRLVDMYLLEAKLNGIQLTGEDKKTFIQIIGKLVESKNHFRNRVMLSHNLFSHNVDDFGQVVDLPKHLVAQMAVDKTNPSRGPWKVTLNQNIYNAFLENCSQRLLRWNVWQAYNNRASIVHDQQNLSNHTIIKDIRQHRKDIAELLGYENFVEMSMATKMAGSVENVLGMIENLKTRFKPKAEEEVRVLQDFANSEGFHTQLEMWDLPYWRRRHRQHLFKLGDEDFRPYFQYSKVLDGMFSWAKKLFGIEVENCTHEADTWHRDVAFYRVHDVASGDELATLYIDPYDRPHQKLVGAWVESGRERSELMGTKPIAYMNLNLTPPLGSRPTLLTTDEAATIFYEFGHALQQMLTTVPYSEIAGQRNVEWDSLPTCALVMMNLFFNPVVIKSVSGHWETGEPIPQALVDTINDVRSHMCCYDMMRQLYFSAYDMEMYISDEYWAKTMPRVWEEYMPLPLHEDDNHPCSLSAIFSDLYPAAFYSTKWAEMIAADIGRAFSEVDFENPEELASIGKRFRDTYLSLGGGVSAGEVFRRFRGRDPSMDALIVSYGGKL